MFGYYSRVYNEGTDNRNWGDAYTGMVLANSAASLIFGMYYVIAFTEKPTTTKMYMKISYFFILNLNSTESPLWILMNYTATKISRQSPLYKIRYSFVLFCFVLFCFQEKELTFCVYKMCVIFSGYCGESFWPLSGHSLPLDRLFYPHWKPIGSRHRPTSSPLIRAKIQMKLKGLQLNSFVYVKKKSKI